MGKNVFCGSHFEFSIGGGDHWSEVVVPAFFGNGILKPPLEQSFMLLSGSAHPDHIYPLD